MTDLANIKKQHQKGHLKKAIDGYQTYLKKNPNDDEAHFGLALAYKDNKLFKEALESAKNAVKLAPNAERYHQFIGQMYMALRESDAALKAFRESLKHNPNLYFSYLAIGDIYLLKEQFQQAEEQYRLAQRVHHEAVPAAVKLAKLLLLTGRTDEADSVLQAAALHQPEDPELKLYQGIVHLETGEFAFAEMHFKKLLKDHANYPLAKAYLAISLMDSDRRQAAQYINELIDAKSQSPELMAATGMMSLKQKHYNESINYLMSVCRSPLAYPSWFLALSQAFVALGHLAEAKQVINKLLERGANDRAIVMLGLIELRDEHYQQAIDYFNRIAKDSPQYPAALKHVLKAYVHSSDWQQVLETANKLLALNPDYSEAVLVKSHALAHLNQPQQALQTLESGLANEDLSDITDDLHLYAGLLLDDEGNYPAAWQHFSAQQTKSPEPVKLLSQHEEKIAQKWSTAQNQQQATEKQPVFVFSDTTTGHAIFVDRLTQHGIKALTDRFRPSARQDLFSRQWQFQEINDLPDTRCHLLRKKYRQHLKRLHQNGPFADFIPTTSLNMALIKKIFPAAPVILLDRNMADRMLHQQVFGNGRYSADDFRALKNQMIAMNTNIRLIDIDALINNETSLMQELSTIFDLTIDAYKLPEKMAMQQIMLPEGHWKNYREFMTVS